MQRWAHAVILASGWKRSGLGLLAGAVCALAMPPIYAFPALVVGMTLAVWLLDGSEPGRGRLSLRGWWSAFRIGWWFGFGYFLAGLWWLGAAFLVESDQFLWALPLGVIGLPAGLALFHGLGFMLARALWGSGARRVLALAVGLGGAEYLRGHVLSGFPWNAIGQAFGASLPTLQAASIFGLEALTLLAIAMSGTWATLGTGQTVFRRWLPPILGLVALVALGGFGVMRLKAHGGFAVQTGEGFVVPGVALRIIQPNVSQRDKNQPGAAEPTLRNYLELSDSATSPDAMGLANVTHLFWPESPFPFILADEPSALRLIGEALPPGTTLITGAVRLDHSATDGPRRFFNSLQVVGTDGVISDSYDKLHLVPFGEYLPFAEFLNRYGLRQFITTPGGFEPGAVRKTMKIAGLPIFLPLICYEVIFPNLERSGSESPQLLVNLTNDAWFGETFGPYQHLEQARMRAVETGLPLIRSANTGISAVIDPYGRSLKQLLLGQRGVIDSVLPVASEATIAVRYNLFLLPAVLIAFLLGCIFPAKVE
jgi:apolipoprotein N-acyltransferase